MGFEKNNEPKKGASKGKIVFMIGLAGVLGAVIFFHFSNSPQTADAAGTNAVIAAPTGDASTEIAALTRDPTKQLLNNSGRAAEPSDIPANPFAISQKWYGVLHKNVITRVDPAPNIRPADNSLPPINIDVLKQDIKLQSIYKDGGKRLALINGHTTEAGNFVGKIQIVDVLEDRVTCQVPGYGEAGRFEIFLNTKIPG